MQKKVFASLACIENFEAELTVNEIYLIKETVIFHKLFNIVYWVYDIRINISCIIFRSSMNINE